MNITSQIKAFIKQSLIGGLLVVAPFAILWMLFDWLFSAIRGMIQPFSSTILKFFDAPVLTIDMVVIVMMLIGCFIIGTIVSTTFGRYLHGKIDGLAAKVAPGYKMIKGVVTQLFGNNQDSPFKKGTIALVNVFGKDIDTRMLGIVTDTLPSGHLSIMACTSPNPTSGQLFIVSPDLCELREDISIDQAFRIILAGGAGMSNLLQQEETSSK